MTDNIFKQVFDKYPDLNGAQARHNTKIVIIAMDEEKKTAWRNSRFWGSMVTENIHIEFLANPCCYRPGDGQLITEVEAKFMFVDSFWQKIKKDGPAASICVSHMRALYQGLNSGDDDESPNKTELVVVLEEDVVPEEDDAAEMGLATVLANFYGNLAMSGALLVGLTWSQHLPNFQQRKHNAWSTTIRNSKIHPYHQLVTAPSKNQTMPNGKTKILYEFIGQGARAQAYSRGFAQLVLSTQVRNFWDLHVISLCAMVVNDYMDNNNEFLEAGYTMLEPIAFRHPVKLSERLRGSGRLQSSSEGPVEEFAFFIMCDLSKQWGLANRTQTLMWWATWAAMHQSGLYVLWAPNNACNSSFEELYELELDKPPFNKIPFIKIMSNSKDNFWTAPAHHEHYCLGKSESQCEYARACGYFAGTLRLRVQEDPGLSLWLDQPIAELEKYEQEDTKMWAKGLKVKDTILNEFNTWWAPYSEDPLMQAAIHIRRGDHMYLNRDLKAEQAKSFQESEEILKQWSDTDEQVEARADDANQSAQVLRICSKLL